MAIHLVQNNEHITYRRHGAEIYYRRIPSHVRTSITKKHTDRRGQINWSAVGDELLVYAITGWKPGTVLMGGEAAPCTDENKLALPEIIKGEIIEDASDNVEQDQERDLGNSETTHDSKPTTTA